MTLYAVVHTNFRPRLPHLRISQKAAHALRCLSFMQWGHVFTFHAMHLQWGHVFTHVTNEQLRQLCPSRQRAGDRWIGNQNVESEDLTRLRAYRAVFLHEL